MLHDGILMMLDDVQYYYVLVWPSKIDFKLPGAQKQRFFVGDLEPSTAGGMANVANVPVRRAYDDFRVSKLKKLEESLYIPKITSLTWSVFIPASRQQKQRTKSRLTPYPSVSTVPQKNWGQHRYMTTAAMSCCHSHSSVISGLRR